MPTLRLVYLTDQQYAGMTDHAHGAANNTTAEQQPSISNQDQTTRLVPAIADATRNASSSIKNDHEEDNDYLDTLLQESIDAVNSRSCSFGGHAVRYHQQVQQEMALSSDEDSKNDSTSSERVRVVDALQQFQVEILSSDEEIENDSTCTSSVHLEAIQQTSGNKRKRRAPKQSFENRFNDLMTFKAKYGHCDVSCIGENASLGKWYSQLRGSYKRIQNNQKPQLKLSDAQIQRLNNAGFKWSLRKAKSGFDEHFNDLMAFKAKYGHCDVPQQGEDASLRRWCSQLRVSYKKIQNNQKPVKKLSVEQIQRLNDAGFKWSLNSGFDERLNDLMAFKAKYGHCNVPCRGENASLGTWCIELRGSYKKIQNNQKPKRKISDEQIQRLNDAGFNWSCLKIRRSLNRGGSRGCGMERMKQRATSSTESAARG